MAITDVNQLPEDLRNAASPVVPGAPAPGIPIPSAIPDQKAAPDQQPAGAPTQALPLTTPGQAPSLTPPQAPGQEPSHTEKIGVIADNLKVPAGPGAWAKRLVQAAQTSLSGGLQDYANAQPPANSGILGGLAAQQQARATRIQQQEQNQTQADRERALTAKINVDTVHQNTLNHRESGDYSDKINNEAIQNGRMAVDAATLNASDAGLDPSQIIHANINEQQMHSMLASKNWDPTQHTVWETSSQLVIDPATGKPREDADGSKQFQKMYTIIDTPEKIVLNADSAALLNKYLHTDFKDGQELPGGLGLSQFQMAANSHALQANRDAQLAKIDESAANAQQKLAMDKAQENLGTEFLQVVSGLPNVSDQMKFVSGQHMIPDPTGKNPNGIVDPRSAGYAQTHPNAPNDLVDSYGGKAKYQGLVLNEAKEAEQERKNRADEAEKKVEDLKKQNESGSWSLQEDANGNPTLLNSKNGQTMPAPAGVQARGTKSKADAAFKKDSEPAIAALGYANSYLSNGVFTGSGDEALQEKFFELAKPTTGFRMSQPQMDMLQNSRTWMGSGEAKALHASTGVWFSPVQRQQIVATMQTLANSKLQALHGNAGQNPNIVIAPEGHQVKLQGGGTATKKNGKWVNDQTGQEVK